MFSNALKKVIEILIVSRHCDSLIIFSKSSSYNPLLQCKSGIVDFTIQKNGITVII